MRQDTHFAHAGDDRTADIPQLPRLIDLTLPSSAALLPLQPWKPRFPLAEYVLVEAVHYATGAPLGWPLRTPRAARHAAGRSWCAHAAGLSAPICGRLRPYCQLAPRYTRDLIRTLTGKDQQPYNVAVVTGRQRMPDGSQFSVRQHTVTR